MSSHAIVVGAGPVGALSALLLARNDVAVTLIERNESLATASYAATFHPLTLDLLESLGISLENDPEAVSVRSLQWRDGRGAVRAELNYRLLQGLTKHPFRIHLSQQSLLDRLSKLIHDESKIDFRPGASVISLDLDHTSVKVSSPLGISETLAADIIIGCDGAHSTIRKLAGIGFKAEDYPTSALRAHVRDDLSAMLPKDVPRPLSGLCYFRDGGDGISVLRMSRDTRLIIRTNHIMEDAARVAQALENATPWTINDLNVHSIDTYRLRHGVADSYLADESSVMVIGDAAHVTSTAGGLNMNSGIHDAFALMPLVADYLQGKSGKSTVHKIADKRRNYIMTKVIPRSEQRVQGLEAPDRAALHAHLLDITKLSCDHEAARQFLFEASLLDAPVSNHYKNSASSSSGRENS